MRGKESKSWWRRFVDGVTRLFFNKKKAVVKRKSSSFGISSDTEQEVIPDEETKQIFEEKKQRTTQILLEKLSKKDSKKTKVQKIEESEHQTPLKTAVVKMSSSAPLERHESNPILEPTENRWESKAVFNPAAAYKDGKVHLVYRAIGDNDVSMLGYASSRDGVTIDERLEQPIFSLEDHLRPTLPRGKRRKRISYDSGGGWSGGCEDPRLIFIDENVYLLYTAFDGWNSIRIAFTTISLDDFIHRRWNWSDRILISPPGRIEKNWVLFPEKIDGKFAILHGISPKVNISYVNKLEDLRDDPVLKNATFKRVSRKGVWDSWVRGAGPPPIKTKYGWLLLYHAMDARDPDRYKLGAVILDEHHPEKILYRSTKPILEPDEIYENRGYKAGVIYSCGAVVVRNELFIYYGGADTVSCVAVANLDHFLNDLIATGTATLESSKQILSESPNKKSMYARRKKISKKSDSVA
jgi:beta-1,2-mannobiose phosphorylase / 1,2-beta-oligomannan phosphorylase